MRFICLASLFLVSLAVTMVIIVIISHFDPHGGTHVSNFSLHLPMEEFQSTVSNPKLLWRGLSKKLLGH